MHAYLVAVGKPTRQVTPAVEGHLITALRRAAPAAGHELETHVWSRDDRSAAVVLVSDEPRQRIATAGPSRFATWTGYFAGYADGHQVLARGLWGAGDQDDAVNRLGGVFSAAIIDEHGAQFHTAVTRVDPVYWCEDQNFVYVSSRALAAHLAARHGTEPEYDLEALVGLISAGYFPDETTPFRGVRPLPPAHVLNVTSTGVVCRARRSADTSDDEVVVEDAGKDLGEMLVESCTALPADTPIQCSLTGGKDSRLIATALHAAGVNFATRTAGHPDHPDVVVARQISDMLGVDHTRLSPRTSDNDADTVLVNPIDRARNVLRLTEGMLSAYENIAATHSDPFSPMPVLGGHGGELLRGGYAKYAKDLSPAGAVQFLRKVFLRYRRLFDGDAWHAYRTRVRPWLARVRAEPVSGLDEFYLRYRAGRWSAAARMARTTKQDFYQPFFDDRVTAIARRVPIERRLDERLIHAALRHLAPDLADVPFAGHRWRFDEDRPSSAADQPGWEARAPVTATTSAAATFNWRLGYGRQVQEVFAEQVLGGGPAKSLFEVIDRAEVERLLLGPEPRSHQLCWRIFTASVLVSNTWLTPDATPGRDVEVKLPSART